MSNTNLISQDVRAVKQKHDSATSGTGTAYPSGTLEFVKQFSLRFLSILLDKEFVFNLCYEYVYMYSGVQHISISHDISVV